MTRTFFAPLLASALVLPFAAQAADETAMDANGDGAVTMTEFNEAHPEAGAAIFAQIDVNADGLLSVEEVTAARADGVLPETSGQG